MSKFKKIKEKYKKHYKKIGDKCKKYDLFNLH